MIRRIDLAEKGARFATAARSACLTKAAGPGRVGAFMSRRRPSVRLLSSD